MLEWVKSVNVPTALGILVGIALVTWVQPATIAGVGLLIVVTTLTCIILIVGAQSFMRKR